MDNKTPQSDGSREQTGRVSGWIGVDLDGTLATYGGWKGPDSIGAPIPLMVERVKKWLAAGKTVKIFTARMHGHGMALIGGGVEDVKTPIEQWCLKHIGQVLDITNAKDFGMIELWDDRCIQVQANTGIPVGSNKDRKRKSYAYAKASPLSSDGSPNKKEQVPNGEQEPATVTTVQAGEARLHALVGQKGEFTNASGRICQCEVTGVDGTGKQALLVVSYIDPIDGELITGAFIGVDYFRSLSPNHEASGSGVEDKELREIMLEFAKRIINAQGFGEAYDIAHEMKDFAASELAAMKQSTKGEGQEQ